MARSPADIERIKHKVPPGNLLRYRSHMHQGAIMLMGFGAHTLSLMLGRALRLFAVLGVAWEH